MLPAFANWSVVTQENALVFKSLKKEKGGGSHSCLTAVLAKLSSLSSPHEEEATVGNSSGRTKDCG